MIRVVLWGVAAVVVVVVIDRVLLWVERKGWIHYRRRGLSRSGAAYHGILLDSIFNPSAEHVLEVKYADEQEEAESGEPHRPGREQEETVRQPRKG